ncbi:MAG TPA: YqjK family protein [Burkholderiales bacterium]|nr:YqjK family protein [Burkholderiales bacterium]
MIRAERLNAVARRKANLIVACARHRARLGRELADLRVPIAAADRAIASIRFLRSHPVGVALVIATLAVLGRRHVLRWSGRALLVWRGWRTVRAVIESLAAAPRPLEPAARMRGTSSPPPSIRENRHG